MTGPLQAFGWPGISFATLVLPRHLQPRGTGIDRSYTYGSHKSSVKYARHLVFLVSSAMSNKKLPLMPESTRVSRPGSSREALVSPIQSTRMLASASRPASSERISLTRGDSSRSNVSGISDEHPASVSRRPIVEDSLRPQKHRDIEISVSEKSERDGRKTKCHHFNSQHWWLFEVGAEFLAFTSLGLMLLVLWYYDDKPQAHWQYSHVTLNGVVSFLATVARTGLMVPVSAAIGQRKWLRFLPGRGNTQRSRQLQDFETFDDASRGSLGSLKLIWAVRFW